MGMKMSSRIVLSTLALLHLACSGERSGSEAKRAPEAATPAARDAQAGTGHAEAGVTPGSYEDWCEEHAVPETMCTRCNPDLVAAFKATGDWCAEHGLPESQCLQCSPNLTIVRPPKPEGM